MSKNGAVNNKRLEVAKCLASSAKKYGMKSAPGSFPRQIADGEYIYMDENTPCQYVVLTIYNN